MFSTVRKFVCGAVLLVAFVYFGNAGAMAWQVSDWWLVFSYVFAFMAILGFCVCVAFNACEVGRDFYGVMAGFALACGLASVVLSTLEAMKDLEATGGVMVLYTGVETGTVRPVDQRAYELLNSGFKYCAIGDYFKMHSAISSLTEAIYLGPLTSLLFEVVKPGEKKKPADCIDIYRQVLLIQPNLEYQVPKAAREALRARIKARDR